MAAQPLSPAQRREKHLEHLVVGTLAGAAGVTLGAIGVYQVSSLRLKRLAATRTWIANDTTLGALNSLPGGAAVTTARFNQPSGIVVIERQPITSALNVAAAAQVAMVYGDESQLASDVGGGLLNRAITTVIYDYERWPKTPAAQQADPGPYLEAGAAVAHQAGLKFWAAPSPNIAQVVSPSTTGVLSTYDTFLSLGGAATAARYSDAVIAQSQELEGNPANYVAWTNAFARQAKFTNPRVKVYVTLSGAPGNVAIPAETLWTMMLQVSPYVDGYWLYVPLIAALPASGAALSSGQAVQQQSAFNLISVLGGLGGPTQAQAG